MAAIRRYTALHALGFPPSAIRLLVEAREGAPFPVAPGVTLVVDPGLIGSGADPGPLVETVRSILADIFEETPHVRTPDPP